MGVIRATKPDGSKTSYTNKCGELDKSVPMMIGVSRAVLESRSSATRRTRAGRCRRVRAGVRIRFSSKDQRTFPGVDSMATRSRPAGAVLKKRFDDIFDSARYTKARRGVANDLERAAVAAMASARRHVSRDAIDAVAESRTSRETVAGSRRRRSPQALDVLNKQKKGLASGEGYQWRFEGSPRGQGGRPGPSETKSFRREALYKVRTLPLRLATINNRRCGEKNLG